MSAHSAPTHTHRALTSMMRYTLKNSMRRTQNAVTASPVDCARPRGTWRTIEDGPKRRRRVVRMVGRVGRVVRIWLEWLE